MTVVENARWRNGGEHDSGERGGTTDERGSESAADEGGGSEHDGGKRGGAVALSGAASCESAAGRRDGRAR